MRRLTLILSDLYLPSEGAAPAPRTHELPSLEWLLRFAQRRERVSDWRRWLLTQTRPELAGWPMASISGFGQLEAPARDAAWLATPVHLEARLDHVRLGDQGLLHVTATEGEAWCAEFARVFGPQYSLHVCGERGFLLLGLPDSGAHPPDPARWLGTDIGPALRGAPTAELRRLWAEIEMWLHGAATNTWREREGRRRITALWLWGRERAADAPPGPASAADTPRSTASPATWRGTDPVMLGLAQGSASLPRSADFAAAALGHAPGTDSHVVAEFAALTGAADDALPMLESRWFAPARRALSEGRLRRLDIVANDRVFQVAPRAGWRVWRRRRPWLESLGA